MAHLLALRCSLICTKGQLRPGRFFPTGRSGLLEAHEVAMGCPPPRESDNERRQTNEHDRTNGDRRELKRFHTQKGKLMNETRILLADNHLIFVEALKNLIEPL